jgi:hypothetical protein
MRGLKYIKIDRSDNIIEAMRKGGLADNLPPAQP